MGKAYERLVAALLFLSAVLCAVMLGVVLVGVFYRYAVDEALSWYDEFAGYTLVWLTMVGSAAALARRKHISFDTLTEKLPPRPKRAVEVFSVLCVMGFSLVMLVAGWQLVREMADETAISLPGVKMAWIYGVLPVSGGLMLLIGAVQLAQLLGAAGGRGGVPAAKPMEEAQ